jgi:1-acyl-sn-glycerol-3-phosphate acyltransferase
MLTDSALNILASAVLAGVPLVLALWAWKVFRRNPYTPFQFVFYPLHRVYTRVVWRTEVSGPLPIADGQGAVVVCNHKSSVDPLFIALSIKPIVHWMVAREFFEHWSTGWFLRLCRAIPVNRGGIDTAATKTAIRLVQNGGVLGIFPEGRINKTTDLLLPGRPGAALIALKAQVPVIPCFLFNPPFDGTTFGCVIMRAHVRVAIGRPIDLSEFYGREDDKEVLSQVTLRMLSAMAALSGHADFKPQVAGKRWSPALENSPARQASAT